MNLLNGLFDRAGRAGHASFGAIGGGGNPSACGGEASVVVLPAPGEPLVGALTGLQSLRCPSRLDESGLVSIKVSLLGASWARTMQS